MRALTYTNGDEVTTSYRQAKESNMNEVVLVPMTRPETFEMREKRLARIKKAQAQIKAVCTERKSLLETYR